MPPYFFAANEITEQRYIAHFKGCKFNKGDYLIEELITEYL